MPPFAQATHKGEDGFMLKARFIAHLAHNLEPITPKNHPTRKADHDSGGLITAPTFEELELVLIWKVPRGNETAHAGLHLGQEELHRIVIQGIQGVQPLTPGVEFLIIRLNPKEPFVELKDTIDGQRIPVILGGDPLELPQGAHPITAVIEEVPEVDPSLKHPGGEPKRPTEMAGGVYLIPQSVEGIPEGCNSLSGVRTGCNQARKNVPGLIKPSIPIKRPPHGEHQFDIVVEAHALDIGEELQGFFLASETKEDLAHPHHCVLMIGLKFQGVMKGTTRPGEFLPSQSGVSQTDVKLYGIRIKGQPFLQRLKRPVQIPVIVELMRMLVILF